MDAQEDQNTGGDSSSYPPLELNIILRQTEQACGGCGIWFDWQDVQDDKPKLVVEYDHLGSGQVNTYQHGLGGTANAFGFYLSSDGSSAKHSILVKQTPQRTGLFRADISDIPASDSPYPEAPVLAWTGKEAIVVATQFIGASGHHGDIYRP